MARDPEILLPGERPAGSSPDDAEIERAEARLERLATILDSAWVIPGTGIRFGADAILGLVPGIGDALGLALSAYIVREAQRLGAPPALVSRMAANVGIDVAIGAIPLLGDLFDVYFKANKRNAALLRAHFAEKRAKAMRTVGAQAAGSVRVPGPGKLRLKRPGHS